MNGMKSLWKVILLLTGLFLAVTGPGYAVWADQPTNITNVSSESAQVGIRAEKSLDSGADPQHLPGLNHEKIDVASTRINNDGDPVFSSGGDPFYRSASMIMNNAYPYYETGWTIIIANNGRLPVRIDRIETVWSGGSALQKYFKLDKAVIHRGDKIQTAANGEELNNMIRGEAISPGGRLIIDFSYYGEETDQSGQLMPENANGQMRQLVSFTQDNDSGVLTPPSVKHPVKGGLPVTGGYLIPPVIGGVILLTLGILLKRRSSDQ